MAMTITVITMENTKATTRTSRAIRIKVLGIGALGLILAVCAAINLFGTFTPAGDLSRLINDRLQVTVVLPNNLKPIEYHALLSLQEQALASKPSEPYGWARLSYLRSVTGGSDQDAFAALRMSDTVSPFETQQLPSRAIAWMKFKPVQNAAEQDYQDMLWQKAFARSPDETWNMARQLGLTNEVGKAIARKNPGLAAGWYGRMRAAGMAY